MYIYHTSNAPCPSKRDVSHTVSSNCTQGGSLFLLSWAHPHKFLVFPVTLTPWAHRLPTWKFSLTAVRRCVKKVQKSSALLLWQISTEHSVFLNCKNFHESYIWVFTHMFFSCSYVSILYTHDIPLRDTCIVLCEVCAGLPVTVPEFHSWQKMVHSLLARPAII